MNDAQWIFEAYALNKRQADEEKMQISILQAQRQMLSRLLGLDLVQRVGEESDQFIPLSILCGQPEVMKAVLEEAEAESKIPSALEDPEFDEMSERMAMGDFSDLIPIEGDTFLPVDQAEYSPRLSFDDD